MADVKTRNEQSEQRGVSRRQEFDLFGYNPFSMARRLSEEMDRAFASAFGLSEGSASGGRGMWAPPVEVRERGGNLEICAELPGMNKEDVRVEFTNEGLIIEGERRREHESEEGGYRRSEFSYGRFHRMIPLPEGIDPSRLKAEFKNGVLQIQAPMPEQQRKNVRQIPVSG